MANVFLNLPTTAGNGAGTAVDVSSMGGLKTVTVARNVGVFQPAVTIEFSCETGAPTVWTPLKTFSAPGQQTFVCAAMWMRAVVSNYRGGGAPNCDVASDDSGTSASNLPALAVSGAAAPVDVSALELLKTIQVASSFLGVVNIEISVDGTSYETLCSFKNGGQYTGSFAAQFMRVVRAGVPDVSPGLPEVNVAATAGAGGGGGSISGGGTLDHLVLWTGANTIGDALAYWDPPGERIVFPHRLHVSVDLSSPLIGGDDPSVSVITSGTNLTAHDGGVQSFCTQSYDTNTNPSCIANALLGACEATKTGAGTLINSAVAASAANGDENYSFNGTSGTLRNNDDAVIGTALTVGSGAAANPGEAVFHVDVLIDNVQIVDLGNNVRNFVVPGSGASSPCIAIGASTTGAAQVNTKNMVAGNPDAGYQALLDTTVNAGVRGGFVGYRGAGGGFGGANQMGITYAGGVDNYIIGATANDVCVFNTAVGKRILFGSDGSGFTVGAALNGSGVFVARALMAGDPTAGTGAQFRSGAGDPNGVLVGNIGDTYSDTTGGAGTTFYVKESDSGLDTGWVAK